MTTFVLSLLLSVVSAAPAARGISTDSLLPGSAHVFSFDGGIQVTVSRTGDRRNIRVDEGSHTNYYTIEPVDGQLQVTLAEVMGFGIALPEGLKVDGVELQPRAEPMPLPRGKAMYYICPKDQTMLRVIHTKHDGKFNCPVDGTPMRPVAGRQSEYFLLN